MKSLRRWQQECLPLALAALEGKRNGVIVATTGAGKAICLAETIRVWRLTHPEAEGTIVVTTPSVQLVEQLGTTLADWLGPGIVGRYYTKAKQWKRPVVVACNASVTALAEVLRTHNRQVAVWIADEAHKAVGAWAEADVVEGEESSVSTIADRLGATRRQAYTATPFRSIHEQRIGLFSEVVYRYAPADAIRDGVIVPWRFVQAAEEGQDVDAACVEMIRALGSREERGPGVVDAVSIEDAEGYAAVLVAAGIEARVIHSRQPDGAKAAAIEALRTGQICCIVHVSMLVEGVDLPWLRWGCFRRPVGARVRYIQHLGRYLRAHPGKTEAVILDPCGLEQRFRVTYEEALGWQPPAEEEPEVVEVEPDDPTKEGPDKEPRQVLTARVGSIARYVRQLHGALVAEGVADKSDRKPGAWRNEPPSEKQVGALSKMVRVSARLGPLHRAALGRLAVSPVLTKGLASDAFDLLQAIRGLKGGEVWTPAVPVAIPPDHAFDAVEMPVYVGVAMVDGFAAVALVRDTVTLFCRARSVKDGDTVESLFARGEEMARTDHAATSTRRATGSDQAAIAAEKEAYRRRGEGRPAFGPQWARVGA